MEPNNNPQASTNPEAAAPAVDAAATTPATDVSVTPAADAAAPIDLNAGAAAAPVASTEAATVTPEATAATDLSAATADLNAAAADLSAAAPATGAADATITPTVDATAAPVADATTVPATDMTAGVSPAMGASDATGLVSPTQSSTGGLDGFAMTEPIMRPDLPPAPDPVKQELEAPMKAAGPVPGSIGSATSVLQDGTQLDANGQPIPANTSGSATPNVAFNDPAKQPDATAQPGAPASKSKKAIKFDLKNMNRATLVTLIVIAAIIVIGLVAVLIAQVMA